MDRMICSHLPLWVLVLMRLCLPERRQFDREFFEEYLHALDALKASLTSSARPSIFRTQLLKWIEKEQEEVRKVLLAYPGLVGMLILPK